MQYPAGNLCPYLKCHIFQFPQKTQKNKTRRYQLLTFRQTSGSTSFGPCDKKNLAFDTMNWIKVFLSQKHSGTLQNALSERVGHVLQLRTCSTTISNVSDSETGDTVVSKQHKNRRRVWQERLLAMLNIGTSSVQTRRVLYLGTTHSSRVRKYRR